MIHDEERSIRGLLKNLYNACVWFAKITYLQLRMHPYLMQ